MDCGLNVRPMVEAEFSPHFGTSAAASQNVFQFEPLLIFASIVLRDLHFGLKFPILDLGPRDFFFFFLENDKQFSSQKIVQRPFFHAQITPKQLGFITSDLACAEYNPEGGMHFLPCLKKFHFAIAN